MNKQDDESHILNGSSSPASRSQDQNPNAGISSNLQGVQRDPAAPRLDPVTVRDSDLSENTDHDVSEKNQSLANDQRLTGSAQPDSEASKQESVNEPVIKELILEDKNRHEESFRMGFLLALSIGVLNACTYMERGHVFASSQSGNLLYLALDLASGEYSKVLKYLFPPLMFGLGVIIAEYFKDAPNYPDWRKYPFLAEIGLIIVASSLPDSWNSLANPVFGLCCGLQTITFKRIRGTPVQTVFINGSFQNSLVHVVRYLHLDEHQDAFRALLYFFIVIAYVGGIYFGAILVPYLHQYVSLVSAGILLCCWVFLKPSLANFGRNDEDSDKS